ncbi:hypothetical protein [Methylobacterium sp. 17Sr1-1]|uniref:hypothetical protein n=1 Tax=Methylobacterium sp. 17Sr1-1 TaxID=2202826 RepID=UPI000D6FBE2C|nr:hypothetical protein [Methylobacterium sp. 17Sr1-1]AWN51501.1 hypothetical protein DK412_07205 [Methylobacterium sp. 17Sr1-1]
MIAVRRRGGRGRETAQAFGHRGAAVTIAEHGPRLAAGEDPDVAAIGEVFSRDGIAPALGADIAQVTARSGDSVAIERADGRRFTGSGRLVIAIGARFIAPCPGRLKRQRKEIRDPGEKRRGAAPYAAPLQAQGRFAASYAGSRISFHFVSVVRERGRA